MESVYVITCNFTDTTDGRHGTNLCCACADAQIANERKRNYEAQRAKAEKAEHDRGIFGYHENYVVTEVVLY